MTFARRVIADMDLKGVRVLVTRPAGQAATLARLIEQRGGVALVAPMIRIVPPVQWSECDAQLRGLHEFAGVVFASANGAEMFLHRMAEKEMRAASLHGLSLYAVGKKTASVLENAGLAVAYVPETHSGAELGSFFRQKKLEKTKYLLPRGDHGREDVAEALQEAGAIVVPVVVYRTVGPDAPAVKLVHTALAERSLGVVTFASPSAAEHFADILVPDLRAVVESSVVVGVIGGTTAAAVRRLGLPVHVVARTATAEGLMAALASWT